MFAFYSPASLMRAKSAAAEEKNMWELGRNQFGTNGVYRSNSVLFCMHILVMTDVPTALIR